MASMKTSLNKNQLIAFEEKIAKFFNDGKIRAPIHLYSGNEDSIIMIGFFVVGDLIISVY